VQKKINGTNFMIRVWYKSTLPYLSATFPEVLFLTGKQELICALLALESLGLC
jgi:hypothetical protein